MFKFLFLLFVVVPIVEIALLIQVSEVIGGFATIALIVATALLGAKLVKQQGMDAMAQAQSQLQQGQLPASALFSGVCILVAGVLLVTPGVMTDIFGFMLLVPALRNKAAAALAKSPHIHMRANGFSQTSQSQSYSSHSEQRFEYHTSRTERPTRQRGADDGNVTIEGDFERKE